MLGTAASRAEPTRGVSLIETMIGLVVVSLLLVAGAPSFSNFLQNRRIRNAADAVHNGLSLAKAEAVRRNTSVQFNGGTSTAWSVGCTTQAGTLDDNGVDTCPAAIQSNPASSDDNLISVTPSTATGATPNNTGTVVFNGFGQAPTALALGDIHLDFANSQGTCIANGGTLRCLRVSVNAGGQIRTCDPAALSTASLTNLQAC